MSNEMLKIMFVDDEDSIRKLLKICIDWNELGIEIAGEASSGREALDLIEFINPDIIVTDIRMPFMDGIEFSRIVAEEFPHIKVMILTAHEEFEIAKKGIKIGIADFLLKPIKRSEIKSAVLNLKSKIESERMHSNELAKLKMKLEENMPYLREKFLNELLQNNLDQKEISDRASYFSIHVNKEYIQLAVIEPLPSDLYSIPGEETKLLLGIQCLEFVRQYFKDDANIIIFIDINQRIVILDSNPAVDLIECCEQIKIMLINRLKCFLAIGIGNSYSDLIDIKKSYKEAVEALNHKFIYGKNNVICYSEISFSKQKQDLREDIIGQFSFYIKAELLDKAVDAVEDIFNEIQLNKTITIDYIRVLAINIVSIVINTAIELGLNYFDLFENGALPYAGILRIDTLPDMKANIKSVLSSAIKFIKNTRQGKASSLINDILTFLQGNLVNEELSLSGTAKVFHLNPSYLSRIFKHETDNTFIEYLTKIRIEKAIDLFRSTDMKVYEVAEKVGIPDPNYFGKCFKKHTGMSVNDFKRT